jgi:CheY-like chemotaxis protein/3-hydroxyisobutyrate dehydrogenase-like beta-hydroxyacid dehydrogenase
VIVSVCPPEFARDVAGRVARAAFKGLYADVNAVSPDSKIEIARVLEASGASFVDGGIIGLPPKERGRTWLYLSGPNASELASLFTAGPMEVEVLSDQPGKASALKMCYAAWSKGSTALIASIVAAADQMSVLEDLKTAWSRGGPVYSKVETDILRAAPKAWRYAGEMREIAATLEAAGLPGGFHHAAEGLYNRLKALKDSTDVQMIDVLKHMNATPPPSIVLAEDNPADVGLVREALRVHNVGCDLRVISDGNEVVAFIDRLDAETKSPCPDLILLDLHLPNRDGREILSHLRASQRCAGIPVVVLTSSDWSRDREAAGENDAFHYFVKPTSLGQFMQLGIIVKDIIGRFKRQDG